MQGTVLPKISVIIPVLNGEKFLEKAICSVLDQDYKNTELIILDAGSTDSTLDIIKRYESHIRYWHSKPDGSAYKAINLGIEQSTGDLIAQLMADDWFEPAIFQKVAHAFLDHPDAEVISCGGRIVYYDENVKQYKLRSIYTSKQQIELNFHNVCFGTPAMSTRFFTPLLIKKVGLMIPFDSLGNHIFSSDREFLLRIIVNHCKSIVISHLGHTYFAHQGSATFGKNHKNTLKILQEHRIIAKEYLTKYKLARKQRFVLVNWYNDQSIRFLLFKLIAGDFSAACSVAAEGVKETKLSWLISLIFVPVKIMARRILGFLHNKRAKF